MITRTLTNKQYAKDITRIHLESFRGFFLTFLGEGFLQQMYQGFITHNNSSVIGAFDDNNQLVGFVAYSENISEFYQYLIKESIVPLAWYSSIAFLKKPKVMFRLLRAFTYSENSRRDEPYVELASIGVLRGVANQGVGSRLIEALKKDIDPSHFAYIKLETDKKQNDGVNAFYIRNGFELDHSFTTREGREMNEYRFIL